MKFARIAPIALALLLLALPAGADRRSHHDADERIASLAQRLDRATSDLYCEAAERARYRSWRELRAMHALRRLERRADSFARQVRRHGADDRRVAGALDSLEQAYRVAAARRGYLRRPGRLDDEFARVDKLLRKLDRRLARLEWDDERIGRRGHRHAGRRAEHGRAGRPHRHDHYAYHTH